MSENLLTNIVLKVDDVTVHQSGGRYGRNVQHHVPRVLSTPGYGASLTSRHYSLRSLLLST